jgi:drug/metabolite transporter (DMT)-like permease
VATPLHVLDGGGWMTTRGRLPLWLVFLALGFMWGSSYFWIKIGVATIPPLTLIALRLLLGFLVLVAVVATAREPLPRNPRQYGHLLVMGVLNVVLPFFLITWGEQSQSMDSALASILNATVPLFVLVLAPLFLPDERITLSRLIGLFVGFVGVIVLFAPGLVNLDDHDFVAEGALLASAVSYAVGAVYSRRNVHGLRPMIPALFQVGFALLIAGVLALVIEHPIGSLTPAPEAIVAILWLGILGSGVAYLAFFRILQEAGATRTTLVAYLLPVVGIAMGTIRGEAITIERIVGTALIVGGIALVNSASIGRWRQSVTREPALAATETRVDPASPE